MDSVKIGEFIKKIRKDNNLTQKELANKYGVTYQAVSKWENGKNLPDIALLREIAKDFNIELTDILDGEVKDKKEDKKNNKYIIIIIILLLIVFIGIIIVINKNSSFEFKTIESNCNDFKVSGSLAYDKNKSSIYISNIHYCGNEDNTYSKLTCNLYEKNNNTIKEISSCDSKDNITLEDYLKNIKFNVENFSKTCNNYTEDSLYLEINAYSDDNNFKTYKIPLSLEDNCK